MKVDTASVKWAEEFVGGGMMLRPHPLLTGGVTQAGHICPVCVPWPEPAARTFDL